jgi:DNA repair protein RecO (recombination protein O)
MGLIRGGASRKLRPVLQPGNTLHLHWRARLSEHLGNFGVEVQRARAGTLLDLRDALTGLNAFTGVARAVLPEREAHGPVYEAGEILLDSMLSGDFRHWAPIYVRWEAGLLDELGFGLDLSECAATGTREDLAFVSPRSGRAVSTEAAKPYEGRLLALPAFLLGSQAAVCTAKEIDEGLKLTEHFLAQRVFEPQNQELPAGRRRLGELAARESK